MKIDLASLAAILAMAGATYFTRISGFVLMRRVRVCGRTKVVLDALPPAILMAVIAPTIFATGPAETLAAVIVAAAAMIRLPLIAVVATGCVSVVILRAIIG